MAFKLAWLAYAVAGIDIDKVVGSQTLVSFSDLTVEVLVTRLRALQEVGRLI